MPKPFRCIVAIPTRALFQGEVYYANVPGSEGDYGVMADHEMSVTTNRPGVLTLWLDPEGKKKKYFVTYGGFAQTFGDQLSVLARMGRDADKLDVEDTRQKLAAITQKIAELEQSHTESDAAVLETSRVRKEWYELQLHAVGADK